MQTTKNNRRRIRRIAMTKTNKKRAKSRHRTKMIPLKNQMMNTKTQILKTNMRCLKISNVRIESGLVAATMLLKVHSHTINLTMGHFSSQIVRDSTDTTSKREKSRQSIAAKNLSIRMTGPCK